MGSLALEESFENRPDHKTQHEEWVKWYKRYKVQRYYETHKDVVTWGNEYIVTPNLYGAWIEVKYIPYKGLEFDIRKEGLTSKEAIQFVKDLGNILELLFWDVGWYSPFIIEIDDQGMCHLLACTGADEKVRSLDMILRTGTKQTVTVDKEET